MREFYGFYSVSTGIVKLFVLISVGYFAALRGLIGKGLLGMMSRLLIVIFVPSLIFYKISSSFDPAAYAQWWRLPIYALLLSFLAGILAVILKKPAGAKSCLREFICANAFQNCGYLPMTLVAFVCNGAFCDRILVYIFLFMLGFNIVFWAFTPFFLLKKPIKSLRLSAIFNPPVVAALISILWVFVFGRGRVPPIIADPVRMVGNAAFPLSMIVLGGYLAHYRGLFSENWRPLFSSVFIKLVLVPLAVFLLLLYVNMPQGLKFFLLLEAAMPAAVSLILIGSYTNADNKFISSAVFYSHLFAVVTVPAWLLVFEKVF